ncbi:hypothetical protein OC834_005489 [Tilletia horrida]|nr:hypothetical protein OC834_005489 [Tilletia horrida]
MKIPALSFAVAAALATASLVDARQRVLVYTKTLRFRHDSIPNAIAAVTELGSTASPPGAGWDTVATEDESVAFASRDTLYAFDALVFIRTTGEVLSPRAAQLMRQYLEDGGSFVGIHAAADCMRETPWFGRVLGAYFRVHPEITKATLQVAAPSHPSVSFLKNGTWDVEDEIYTFNSNPRDLNHTVLLTIDDDSYPDPVTPKDVRQRLMGSPHPLAWYKDGGILDGGVDDPANSTTQPGTGGPGRSWYTSLGHDPETYADPLFRQHLAAGIRWALDAPSLRSGSKGTSSSPGQPRGSASAPGTGKGTGTGTAEENPRETRGTTEDTARSGAASRARATLVGSTLAAMGALAFGSGLAMVLV